MDKDNLSGEKALIEERRKKLDQLRDRGSAYGNSFKPNNVKNCLKIFKSNNFFGFLVLIFIFLGKVNL